MNTSRYKWLAHEKGNDQQQHAFSFNGYMFIHEYKLGLTKLQAQLFP